MTEMIVLVCVAVVLFVTTQLVKTFAKDFFAKISKLVPVLEFVLATILSSIALLIAGEGFNGLYAAVKNGFIVASAEVYTYEGIYKLFEKLVDTVTKAKGAVEKVEEKTATL